VHARGTDPLPRLTEAARVHEATTERLEQAQTFVALGEALVRAGRGAEAATHLQRALRLAEPRGAAPLAARARAALGAAGLEAAPALTGLAALTAPERRVAALAAEGVDTRAIAQALFLTPHAVEEHVAAVYRKLGVASPDALAGALTPA
jgi:DNA-binding NarL/FixJ family response regulator